MTSIIQTTNLTKYYSTVSGWRNLFKPELLSKPAVSNVNLQINQGEIFGLLGPNGAGKTTLIKILATLILPTTGTASVFGYDLSNDQEIRNHISLVTSDERSFYWRLTGWQNLEFFANLNSLFNQESRYQIRQVLELVDLMEFANQSFQTYSTGMRQRLAIARALLNQPRLLFLDEPSKGLDPRSAENLHKLILSLKNDQGITIFLTTHLLDEAEKLCDRLGIMDQGRILVCGSIRELYDKLILEDEYEIHYKTENKNLDSQLVIDIPGSRVIPFTTDSTTDFLITIIENHSSYQQLNRGIDYLRKLGGSIVAITPKSASLLNIFKKIVAQDRQYKEMQPGNPDSTKDFYPSSEINEGNPQHAFPVINELKIIGSFIKRDWWIESSYRLAFFLQFIGIFFSVTMFYFISLLFGESASQYLTRYNADYFSFVLIGIAFSSYLSVGISGFSNSIRQAQTTGTLEAMLTTPARGGTIIFSSSLWQYIITTIRVLVYLLIGVLFMHVSFRNANILSALVIIILSIFAFSSIGIVAASFIMVLKRGDPITWIITSFSSLLGGVYYPVDLLPPALQWLAFLIPITYTLDAMRLALLNGYTLSQLQTQILALLAFCIILIPVSFISFRFAVRKAKTDGSLTHY